jgi:hypothetical protein
MELLQQLLQQFKSPGPAHFSAYNALLYLLPLKRTSARQSSFVRAPKPGSTTSYNLDYKVAFVHAIEAAIEHLRI